MNKPSTIISIVIVLNACIWGFAIIMSARALGGDAWQQIQGLMGGSAAASLILVGGGLVGLAKRLDAGDKV